MGIGSHHTTRHRCSVTSGILASTAALLIVGLPAPATASPTPTAASHILAATSTISPTAITAKKSKRAKKAQRKARNKVCRKLPRTQRNTLTATKKPRALTKKDCKIQLRIWRAAKKKAKQEKATQTPAPQATTPAPIQTTPQPAPYNAADSTVFGLSANGESAVKAAENRLGLTAGVLGVFTDFTMPFPAADAAHAAERGASLLISWEPWDWEVKSQNQPTYSLDNIAAGHFDDYIRDFARGAAATAGPVYVRWAAEMNGDWHVWSTGNNGNGAGDYAAAHRHLVDVARAAGGTNIKWMFNPIVSYEGSTPLAQLYPGDSYVDWVALDGYNWGDLKWGWQSFTDIFTMGLNELGAVAPNKPLAIAEVGSTPGAKKAEWVADTLTRAKAAGARMIVWFEHNKETDWRLSVDPAVAAATTAVVTQPGWVTGGDYGAVRAALGD
jgi:beta-mannanase